MRLTFILPFIFFCNYLMAMQPTQRWWKGEVQIQNNSLPILLKEDKKVWSLLNGEEIIKLKTLAQTQDSLVLEFTSFGNKIELKKANQDWVGKWIKSQGVATPLEFNLKLSPANSQTRFAHLEKAPLAFAKKWSFNFSEENDQWIGIGIFEVSTTTNIIRGSIATATGDYRYLEGGFVTADKLMLYGFDGQFSFVIEATLKNNLLEGTLRGGYSWLVNFKAAPSKDITLPDASSQAKIISPSKRLSFKGESIDGDAIDLTTNKRTSKITIIQILGSWCPNCIDETLFFKDFLKTAKKTDVSIIGFSFEKAPSEQLAMVNLRRLQNKLGVKYPLVLASWNVANKNVLQVFPELEKHLSYPTNLWLNQKGEIIYTHVGFTGPATKELYTEYKNEFQQTLSKFLKQP